MHVIGEIDKLPELVQEQLMNIVEITKNNSKTNLVLALSYGSQKRNFKRCKENCSRCKTRKNKCGRYR